MRFVSALAGVAISSAVLLAGGGSALAAHTSRFCQESVVFEKSSISSNLATLPPATLKSDYAKVKGAQPAMESSAPKSIKTDLKEIFNFDDGIFVDLSKVGWVFSKLPASDLRSLGVNGPKLKPAGDKVTSYLDKTCGLKLPLP